MICTFAFLTLLPVGGQAQNEALPVRFDETPLVIETAAGEQVFRIEIVSSPEERGRGLMFRKSMPEDAGMLFDFGNERMVSMWMRNTWLPLDMLFIAADGTVRTIALDTEPFSEVSISSNEPVRYVLEINSGIAEARNIAVGDVVRHPAFVAAD